MKNQYFGDYRDLFKYDLVQEVMENLRKIKRFSFIPMLTEFKECNDGNKRDYNPEKIEKRPGSGNRDLVGYLREYNDRVRDQKNRDLRHIGDYFKARNIKTEIFEPGESGQDKYFVNKNRSSYFQAIPDIYLESALVFVDPDNGLEVNNSSKKHILYPEVSSLYERMSDDSLLMIYQHFPRQKHEEYINRRKEDLRQRIGSKSEPLWISDNEIIFFFLSKDHEVNNRISGILYEYSGRYPEKCRAGCVSRIP